MLLKLAKRAAWGVLELPELAIDEFVKVLCIFLAPRTKQIHRAT
jgi:hypothetical protein